MLAESQMLLLPLDVANYRNDSNIQMRTFWYIIYLTSAAFICIVLPFALFYYETDEEKEFVSAQCLTSAFRNGDCGLL